MTTTNSNFRVKNALQLSSGALISNTVTDRVSMSGTLDVNTASIFDIKFPSNGSIQSLYEGGIQIDTGTDGATSHSWTFNPTGTTNFPHYEFPADDGAEDQYLSTDGAGHLTWVSPTVNYTRVAASATTTTNTSTGLILISDNGGRAAYYNTTASTWKYVGTDVTVYTPTVPFAPTDISGCVLWCDITSVSLGTNTWTDMSGSGNHGSINGSPTLASTSGNGATAITTALSGGQSDYVSWIGKSLLPSSYTCFTVSRYSGSHKERIWTGSNMGGGSSGWFSGHHGNKAGVGYANGWVGPSGTDFYGTNWTISVQSPYYYQANGNASTLGTGGTTYITTDFTCNGKQDGESSDFQTVECIIYNSTLGSTDRTTVLNYLATKYGITLGV